MGPTMCYSSDNHVPVRLLTVVHVDIYFKSQCSGLGLLKGCASVNGGTSILGGESSEDVDQAGSAGGPTASLSAAAFVCKGVST